MKLFDSIFQFHGFDVWHKGNFAPSTVAISGSYNDLSNKPTIPTTLPANGGNADTVDGKHATDFALSGYGLGVALSGVTKSDSNSATITGMYYAVSSDVHKPAGVSDGALFVMAYSTTWINQLYMDWRTNKSYRRMCTNGVWNSWEEIARIADIPVQSVAGKTGAVSLSSADVGLGNVDNTSDTNKPVSTLQQAALNLKANLASPTFTGTPKSVTPSIADNSTNIATTAFIKEQGYITSASAGTVVTVNTVQPTSPKSGDVWIETS